MDFNLVIGEAVPAKKLPKNLYCLNIEFMSGDADHSEYVLLSFEQNEEDILKDCMRILEEWKVFNDGGEDFGEFCENEAEANQFNKENKKSDKAYTILGDAAPSDVTSDHSRRASPESYKLSWYDENGIQYYVSIIIHENF